MHCLNAHSKLGEFVGGSVQNKERELEQKRLEMEEAAESVTGNFESLQQEIEIKTKKLKKVS